MPGKYLYVLALLVCLMVQPARAQFTVSAGPVYVFGNQSKGNLPLVGLEGKLGADLNDQLSLNFSMDQLAYIQWERVEHMDIGLGDMTLNVPLRVPSTDPLVRVVINEFSLITSYYFVGRNISAASLYGTLGPGVRYYRAYVTNEADPSLQHTEKATDIILDMRVGGQVWIAIGWLYLEAKLAPPIIFPTRSNYYDHNHNTFFGANLGIRFLLNAHPRCKLE